MSNEAKMTLEEKVTQRIKSDTLMSIVGDEEAITELVRRAVNEALYQPVRIPRTYGGYDERDSIAVAAARDVAKEVSAKLTQELVAKAAADPAILAAMVDAMQAALPGALMYALRTGLSEKIMQESDAVARRHVGVACDLMRQNLDPSMAYPRP